MTKQQKLGVIYAHINKINNKVYVGQTIQNPKNRWNNGEGYKESKLFYSAIQKYGWNNFEHIILESNLPQEKLNEREIYWIAYYKSDKREFGYNLTSGGYQPLNNEQKENRREKLKKWREEHQEIAQWSIKQMQKYWEEHPEERQQTLKKATIESVKYWQQHPKEKEQVMQKMRENAKKTNIKPVICLETNKIYESAREADRQTGIKYYNIGKACNGSLKTAGGYHWAFYDKEDYLKKCKSKKEMVDS